MKLDGCRVLVVEDDGVIAASLASMLRAAGCRVAGPFFSLGIARAAARTEEIDAALLDVNLNGELVFPVAAVLGERGVPFAFVTGDSDLARGAYPRRPILDKPFMPADLRAVLSAL